MKKKIFSLIMALTAVMCAAVAAHAQDKSFGNSINAVFFGGSITQGAGASSEKMNYVSLVGEYLKSAFSEKDVTIINAGIPGTDSKYGWYRLENDIISNNPDIVFIEFSVNDHYNDTKGTNTEARSKMKGYMESVIRRLAALPDAPAVVFVNTTDNAINTGDDVSFANLYAELCEAYGIKAVDIEGAVREAGYVTAANAENTILVDGTHPNDKGYKIYADKIISDLSNGGMYLVPSSSADWVSSEKYRVTGTPRVINYADMTFNGDWEDNAVYKGAYTAELKMSTKAGDSVSMDFYGSTFCLGMRCNQFGGNYSLEIDGNLIGKFSTYNAGTWPMEFPRGTVTGLDANKKHTAKITVLGTHEGASSDSNVIIFRAFCDDGKLDGKLVIGKSALSNSIASASLYNKTDEDINADAIFAQYDSNGVLIGTVRTNALLDSREYTTVANTVAADSDRVYAFVWKNGSALEPICKKISIK